MIFRAREQWSEKQGVFCLCLCLAVSLLPSLLHSPSLFPSLTSFISPSPFPLLSLSHTYIQCAYVHCTYVQRAMCSLQKFSTTLGMACLVILEKKVYMKEYSHSSCNVEAVTSLGYFGFLCHYPASREDGC